MKKVLFAILAGLACTIATAQEVKTHISKEFTQAKGTVAIYNISGSVKVEGYSGDKVLIEIDQTISAKNEQALEQGKQEVKLEFEQKGDTVRAYVTGPSDSRPYIRKQNNSSNRDYHFSHEYVVKVPMQSSLQLSTVNGGEVSSSNVAGTLYLRNVNGSILVTNAKGTTDAQTVNGKVTVNYNGSPAEASTYKTVNGEIRVTYPPTFSGDLQFKTLNGSIFTNFSETEALPLGVEKTVNEKTGMTTYKTNKTSALRIGKGGNVFKFETVNGSIYIQKP
jgi:DUF4097 and DUF4098 domain-containing protein YvlB